MKGMGTVKEGYKLCIYFILIISTIFHYINQYSPLFCLGCNTYQPSFYVKCYYFALEHSFCGCVSQSYSHFLT